MELNIEEIKKANEEMNEKMKEIWDALIDLGSEVKKGDMSIEDARKRLQRYISYMYVCKMLCTLNGKRFYASREMRNIWDFDV